MAVSPHVISAVRHLLVGREKVLAEMFVYNVGEVQILVPIVVAKLVADSGRALIRVSQQRIVDKRTGLETLRDVAAAHITGR